MKIESYKVKGRTKYRFRAFLGKDPITGKQQRAFRSGFDTKREAEKAYLELTTTHKPTEKSKATFRQVYGLWMETYRLGVKESTLIQKERLFEKHILPTFGEMKLLEITPPLIQQFINQQYQIATTADSRFSALKRVLTFARKQGYIYQNPAELTDLPKIPQTEESDNFYTKAELEEFLSLCEEKLPYMWQVFFRLLAYTGIRKGEALALTWDDINQENRLLLIYKTVSNSKRGLIISNTPKTKKSYRSILLDNKTAAMIDGLDKSNEFLFPNKKGGFKDLTQPAYQIDKALRGSTLKTITPHGLRHTHCSMLFSAGVSIPEVQERMGHDDVKTTIEIYNHVYHQDKESALQKFMTYMDE